MAWKDVGDWLEKNAVTGVKLVGSLVTGNIPGAIATGISLITGATGTNNPDEALSVLQKNPEAMIRLRELANKEQESIRQHIKNMHELELKDKQHEHEQTQKTIQEGDKSTDEYVRRTRPQMARESWYGTMAYCLVSGVAKAWGQDIFVIEIALILISPAGAYLGLRTVDGFTRKGK